MARRRQAPALTQAQWSLWLTWLREHAGPRVWLVVFLTGALGLRRGEALALRREEVVLNPPMPSVRISGEARGSRKSPGNVYIKRQHLSTLRDVFKNGARGFHTKGHKHGYGSEKTIQMCDLRGAECGLLVQGARS